MVGWEDQGGDVNNGYQVTSKTSVFITWEFLSYFTHSLVCISGIRPGKPVTSALNGFQKNGVQKSAFPPHPAPNHYLWLPGSNHALKAHPYQTPSSFYPIGNQFSTQSSCAVWGRVQGWEAEKEEEEGCPGSGDFNQAEVKDKDPAFPQDGPESVLLPGRGLRGRREQGRQNYI